MYPQKFNHLKLNELLENTADGGEGRKISGKMKVLPGMSMKTKGDINRHRPNLPLT